MTDVTPSLTTELDARAQGNARAVKTPFGRMGLYDPRNEHVPAAASASSRR